MRGTPQLMNLNGKTDGSLVLGHVLRKRTRNERLGLRCVRYLCAIRTLNMVAQDNSGRGRRTVTESALSTISSFPAICSL